MIDLRIAYDDCYMSICTKGSALGYASVICKDGSGQTTGLILAPGELADLYQALKNHFEPKEDTNG